MTDAEPSRADDAMRGMANVQEALRALAGGDEGRALAALDGSPAQTSWAAATLLGIVHDVFTSVAGNDAAEAARLLAGLADSMDGDMAETGATMILRDALRGQDPT